MVSKWYEEYEGSGALPNLIVIGAMKCATTAVHRYLDLHPDVAMSEPKELNFFFGPPERLPGLAGNWHRGVEWYAAQFRPSAAVRGEASPGYTSRSFPEVAERMARTVPEVRLIYLVRDPIEHTLSHYLHHRAEGTEQRPIEEALLDPQSQYLQRGRYHARVRAVSRILLVRPDLHLRPRGSPGQAAGDHVRALPLRGCGGLVLVAGARSSLEHVPH